MERRPLVGVVIRSQREISALIRRDRRDYLCPHLVRTQGEGRKIESSLEPDCPGTRSGTSSPQRCKDTPLLWRTPSLWYSVMAAPHLRPELIGAEPERPALSLNPPAPQAKPFCTHGGVAGGTEEQNGCHGHSTVRPASPRPFHLQTVGYLNASHLFE